VEYKGEADQRSSGDDRIKRMNVTFRKAVELEGIVNEKEHYSMKIFLV
jgi:hypothetical protein